MLSVLYFTGAALVFLLWAGAIDRKSY